MKLRLQLALGALLLASAGSSGLAAATSTWTGSSSLPYFNDASNWGGTAPASDSANTALVFPSIGSTAWSTVTVNTNININSISFTGAFPAYSFLSEAYVFGLGSGGITVGSGGSSSGVNWGVKLQLLADQTWNIGGLFKATREVSGSFMLTKTGTGTLIMGSNSFTGGFYLQQGTLLLDTSTTMSGSAVVFGPAGTGTLRLGTNSTIAANDFGITLGNAILLESGVTFGQAGSSNDLTLTGLVSLQSAATTINLQGSGRTIFSSNLADASAGPSSLTFTGGGAAVLAGTNTYTNGTTANAAGVVFYSSSAIPSTGSISALNNGYVGVTFDGGMATVVSKISNKSGFAGSLGLDTAPLYDGVVTYNDTLNLSAFSSSNLIGVGTYSNAVFNGSITPVGSGDYKFGGGNGTLSVTTGLAASSTAGVTVSSPVTYVADQRLTVFLRGVDTFTGNVNVSGSNLIFDAASALPANVNFTLGAYGYIGYSANPTNIANFDAFRTRLVSNVATGILGIDSSTRFSPRLVTDAINLSSNSAVYLGTATSVQLTGTITPPSGGTAYLTGVNGGYLKIGSALTTANSVSAVKVGYANSSTPFGYDGIVELDSGSSNYTGGTTLESGYLLLGASSNFGSSIGPIGTGTLTVPSYAHSPALSVTTSGAVIQNNISLGTTLFVGTTNARNYSLPTNADFSLTLSGVISGSGGLSISTLTDATLTLNGANTFSGGFAGNFGNVVANHNTALGTGMVNLESTNVTFNTSAPSIGGITGSYGALVLSPNGATLQINQQQAGSYGGIIDGTNLTVTKTGTGTLELYGYSTYSGTTNINQGKVVLSAGGDASGGPLGVSTVSLGGGELKITNGNTINNPITFSAPSRLTGNATFGSALTIGTNATLAPGSSPGVMSFNSGLTFASGGKYEVDVQSASGTAGLGYDTLGITGTLAFTSTSGSPFRLDLISLSTSGAAGNVSDFSSASSYSWVIATATGGITGFNPSVVSFNTTGFTNSLGTGFFSVTTSGNSLVVNFSPVPEPSTWALLGLGLGGVAISIVRRRRSS